MDYGQWDDEDPEEGSLRARRFCPWCGTQVVPNRQFCPACGKNVSGASPPSAARRAAQGTKKVVGWVASALLGIVILAMFVLGNIGWVSTIWEALGGGSEDPTGGGAARQVTDQPAPTAAGNPCAGYDEWILAYNKELLVLITYFGQTPEPLRGSREEMQTQVAQDDRARDAKLLAIISWLERHPTPPAGAEFRRLNLEAFKIQRKIFAARTFEESERIRTEELVPVDRQVEDAKSKMLDTCHI